MLTMLLSHTITLATYCKCESFKILLLVYRCCVHRLIPNYLVDLFQQQNTGKGLQLQIGMSLECQTHKVTYGDKAFYRAASNLWNNLYDKICDYCRQVVHYR